MSESVPHPIDPSFVERLEHLRFAVGGVVDGLFMGLHKSRRRGGGLVFAEHRAYRPGDDPRTLDWRAFARSDHHRVKHFEHEAQLRAMLVLDVSGSMAYGGPPFIASKLGVAATLLGATAHVLLRQGDAAGVALAHDHITRWVAPRGGNAHASAVMDVLATPAQPGQTTSLSHILDEVAERAGKQGAVLIASDLLDLSDGALAGLSHLTLRGQRVIVMHVLHGDELTLPFREPMRFLGTEGEASLEADPATLRKAYLEEMAAFRKRCEDSCAHAGARYVLARTDRPLHDTLRDALSSEEAQRWA